jgi:hypothetical protein
MKGFWVVVGTLVLLALAACNQVVPTINDSGDGFSDFVPIGETEVDFFKNATKIDLTDTQAVTAYVRKTYQLTGVALKTKVSELQRAIPSSGEITSQALPSDCVGTVGIGRAYYFGKYVAATLGKLTCSSSHWNLNVRVSDNSGLRSGYVLFGRSASAHTDGLLYSSVAGTTMCGRGDFSLRIGTTLYASSVPACSYLPKVPN